jgi:hypothetical protein
MKKTLLTLAIAIIAHFSYAQFSSSGGNTTTTDNVGVGTSTPDFASSGVKVLTVTGSSVRGMLLLQNSSSGINGVAGTIQGYNGSTFLGSVDILADGATNSGAFQFYTVNNGLNVSAMRITKEGNVSIGTTSLSEKLVLRDPNIAYNASSGTVKLLFDSGNGGGGVGFEKETFNTGGLRFYTQYGFGSTIEQMRINATGNVGIGTPTPDSKLAVNGTIHSKEVKVDLTGWPDYVFKPKYKLSSLLEVKQYINQNHHLPEMPSEAEVAKEGINLGEMNKLLTKKVEELTLYAIEQKDEIEQLKKGQEELKAALVKLTAGK